MAVTIFSPYEPKAKNRFIFYIGGIEAYIIKATGLPKVDNGKITVDYINKDFKVKGKTRWEDIDVTLYDPIDPNGAKMVMDWIRLTHTSEIGIDFEAFGPSATGIGFPGGSINPLGYKKNVSIAYLDPKGSEFSAWVLVGAYISKCDFGDVDWSDDSPVEITMTLAYDYAVLA